MKNIRLLLIIVIIPLILDTYLIHRTYQYFGGGALNRPYGLTNYYQYLMYFFQSYTYDLYVNGILFYFMIIVIDFFRVTHTQKIFLSISFTLTIYFIYTVISMQVLSYFGGHFNINALKEVTAGNITNALSFISLKQIIMVLSLFFIPIVLVFIAYILNKTNLKNIFNGVGIKSYKNYNNFLFFTFIIVSNHFYINSDKYITHGLSYKFSYTAFNYILNVSTDFDGDGFGPLSRVKDPDNFNENINSYARDIPLNGIDENGLAGDNTGLIPNISIPYIPNDRPDQNVIVIVVETFRVDVVNKVIDGVKVMPFLSELATKELYTPYMYSNYGVTAKAIQTIFTGKVNYNAEHTFSLFDLYRRFGYKVIGASAQSENWGNTDRILNFSKFDDYYDPRYKKIKDDNSSSYNKMKGILGTLDSIELNNEIFSMLEEASKSNFIMYINYQDLHYPYHSDTWEKKFIDVGHIDSAFFKKENREHILNQYSNAAYHLDQSIKNLFDKLVDLKINKNTVVVIVGDHPDSLYENNILGHAWVMDKHQRQTPYFLINGIGSYVAPFGQDNIFNMVVNSSISDKISTGNNNFTVNKEKEIFLISGELKTASKIGFIGINGIRSYDFTSGEYISDSGGFNQLINYWESLVNL